MNVVVKKNNINIEFSIKKITQFLGLNFKLKQYVYDSIVKHFTNYNYEEYEEYMENNIMIDEEIPGQKEFKIININNRESMIDYIKFTKNSLLNEYIKNTLETLNFQKYINFIDDNLSIIYQMLNEKIKNNLYSLNLNYDYNNIIDIVSKSKLLTNRDFDIEELSNYQLLKNILKLVYLNNEINNEKIIILINNIDHLCSKSEYFNIINEYKEYNDDIFFIFFISTNNYVYIDDNNIKGITVFNDNIFNVPSFEVLESYIVEHYPLNINFEREYVITILSKILNTIGIDNESIDYKEIVFKKLINKAICVNDNYDFNISNVEFCCINSK